MLVLAAPTVGAGGIGFLVIVVLIVAAVFLFRSMNTHVKRVPRSFEETAPEQRGQPPSDEPTPHP